MKHLSYILFLSVAAQMVCGGVLAQNTPLSKQVEVTKDYAPDVEQATKLTSQPRMVDTVKLRPQSEYKTLSLPWLSSFGVESFAPVKVNAVMASETRPFYLKVGGGVPFNSLLDFYANVYGSKGSVVGYINHKGNFSDLKNDVGHTHSASQTSNSAGVAAERYVGLRKSIKAEVGYDYDYVTRYGEFEAQKYLEGETLECAPRTSQRYSTLRATVSFGDDFRDLSKLNFAVGVSGYMFSDRVKNKENSIEAWVGLGKQFGTHKITLKAGFEGAFGADSLRYYDRVVFVSPRYGIETERFKLSAGADVLYNSSPEQNKAYLFPYFRMTFDLTSGYFVPFFEIDGELVSNSYRNLTRMNPYVKPGATLESSAVYRGRAGISGSIASSFSYRAYAGVNIYRALTMFANFYDADATDDSMFVPIQDNATMFNVGGDISGRVANNFVVSLAANYYGYTVKNVEYAGGLPNFDATLDLRYSVKERFSVYAAAKFTGRRYFYETYRDYTEAEDHVTAEYNKISPVIDLSLGAEYRISPLVGVFVEGSNLLNQKLYPYTHYRGFGISCTAGVKLFF